MAIPEVSSETREYIPIDILPPSVIASNKLQIIVAAPLEYFSILTSAMHMAWMRTVCGRMKSDYSYAPAVYNSFPWPVFSEAQRVKLVGLGQAILDARKAYSGSTLEDLYEGNAMPRLLCKAHVALDKFVDALYRRSGFRFERERVEHLFDLHERNAMPIVPVKKRVRRSSSEAAPSSTPS